MRLTEEQRKVIRNAVRTYFGNEARVLLFGSRVDDSRRGGDIDLLVETSTLEPYSSASVEAKIRTIAAIHRGIGERKIDLVVAGPDTDAPVAAVARREGVAI